MCAKCVKGESQPDHNTTKEHAAYFEVTTDYLLGKKDGPHVIESDKKNAIIERIRTEYPDADLMFNDLVRFTVEDMQDVYDFIKFKKSQKKKGDEIEILFTADYNFLLNVEWLRK